MVYEGYRLFTLIENQTIDESIEDESRGNIIIAKWNQEVTRNTVVKTKLPKSVKEFSARSVSCTNSILQ